MGKAKRFLGLQIPRNQREDKALSRQSNTLRSQNITPVTQLKGTPNNEFLKATGGIHFGADGYLSDDLDIAAGILDLQKNPTGDIVKIRKYININPETGTTDTLDLIAAGGAEFPHQELVFIGQSGDTITITHDSGSASGNNRAILCPGAVAYTLNGTDAVALFYDSTLGKWRIEGDATSGGGGGDDLGNHTAIMPLDLAGQDLYFVAGGAERMDSGGSSDIRMYAGGSHKASIDANGLRMQAGARVTIEDEARFVAITKPGTNTSAKIYNENLTNDELVLNAPTSGKVRMDIAGTEIAEYAATAAQFQSTLGYDLTFFRDDSTPNDDDEIGRLSWQGNDSGAGGDIYATIQVSQSDVTAGSEDGRIFLGVIDGGVANDTFFQVESNGATDSTFTLQADQKDVIIDIIRDESTSDTGRLGTINFTTNNSTPSATTFGQIRVDANTVTAASESSTFSLKAYDAGTQVTFMEYTGGTGVIILDSTTQQLGFYGSAGANKQTVTGSRGGNAALQGLLAALANLGIITDSST